MSELYIELELPDHTQELEQTDDYIKTLKTELNKFKKTKYEQPMSVKQYKVLYEKMVHGLYYLGHLSLPAFDAEETIEKTYFEKFKHAPELAKKLWWTHYEKVHHPYTLFKNRLFKMLEDLDELYITIYKCPPPDYVE